MKTWKHGIIGIIAIIALAFAFIACDNGNNDPTDDPNEVKDRTTTRTLSGGIGSVTVKGNLTKPQLDTAADKIAGRINAKIEGDKVLFGEETAVTYYQDVFTRGVTYIVEANPVGYENIKTIGDGKTVYISVDKVDTTYVGDGLAAIDTSTISKAINSSINKRKNNRVKYLL